MAQKTPLDGATALKMSMELSTVPERVLLMGIAMVQKKAPTTERKMASETDPMMSMANDFLCHSVERKVASMAPTMVLALESTTELRRVLTTASPRAWRSEPKMGPRRLTEKNLLYSLVEPKAEVMAPMTELTLAQETGPLTAWMMAPTTGPMLAQETEPKKPKAQSLLCWLVRSMAGVMAPTTELMSEQATGPTTAWLTAKAMVLMWEQTMEPKKTTAKNLLCQ